MLRNGLWFVATEAAQRAGDKRSVTYRDALVLGSLREDVLVLPSGWFTEYPSFRHFGGRGLPGGYLPLLWPGPRHTTRALYRKALKLGQAGRKAAAFVQLGRAAHVLTDMSIPSHVHRAAHQRDPFEWYVEGNLASLRGLPLPPLPSAQGPADLISGMARLASHHAPDRTSTPLGRRLRRLGWLRSTTSREAAAQAHELIPQAVAHTAALLCMYRRELSSAAPAAGSGTLSGMSEEDDVLQETLDALEIPRRGLRVWFEHNRAFCKKHGGHRVYGELMDLMDRCDEALSRKEERERQGGP